MNHAKLQRATHALFSRLSIRAPIEPDHQNELRTKTPTFQAEATYLAMLAASQESGT